MHLLLHRFQLLRPRAQLVHVLITGTYLANRWYNNGHLSLYYLPDGGCGFFAEVGLNPAQDCFVVLRSFSGSEELEEYVQGMQLPGE